MNRKDEWGEEWLNATLAKLGESAPVGEPEAGFEARLLRRLRQETEPAGRARWPLWCGAAGVAAALTILVWIALPAAPGPPAMTAWKPPAVQLPAPKPVLARRAKPPQRVGRARRQAEYSAVFPTPTPLTEQERLLLRYVETAPPEELVRMAKIMKSNDDIASNSYGSSR